MVFKISIQESHVSFSDLDVCKLPGTFQSVVWLEKMFFFSAPALFLVESSFLNPILHRIVLIMAFVFEIIELYHFVFWEGSLVSLDTYSLGQRRREGSVGFSVSQPYSFFF